jgi:hypothetical protein
VCTTTLCIADDTPPSLSTTVSVTVNVPAAA